MKLRSIFLTVSTCALALSGCQKNEPMREAEESAESDQTTKNLEFAFAGECEANRKYLAFSEMADREGYPQVARLWRAAAAAEAIHAKNHMRVLNMVKSTQQNLKDAVEGEQYEFKTMYPNFIKTAEDAGKHDAAKSMEWAFEVEQLHHHMFEADLLDLEKGIQPPMTAYWVCGVCGNTVPSAPPEVCTICSSPKSAFFEVK